MWMENERGLADKGYHVQNGGAQRDKENDVTAKDLIFQGSATGRHLGEL